MPTKHDIQDVECLHYYDDEISSCGCGFIGFKKSQVFDYNFGDDDDDGDSEELFEINLKKESRLDSIREEEWCESSTVFSLDIHNDNNLDDVVYVAVGTNGGSSSMEALSWTLKHAVTPSTTTVSLLHVFPQVKLIPTPCKLLSFLSYLQTKLIIIFDLQHKHKSLNLTLSNCY